jgi:hypothetical protein
MTDTTTTHDALEALDAADFAHLRLHGRAVVLERLFELLEANSHSPRDGPRVDFGLLREEAFSYGLRQIVEDIREISDEAKASAKLIYRQLENRR